MEISTVGLRAERTVFESCSAVDRLCRSAGKTRAKDKKCFANLVWKAASTAVDDMEVVWFQERCNEVNGSSAADSHGLIIVTGRFTLSVL